MSNLQQQPDSDLDEDLFDFAGVARESETAEPDEDLDEIFASFRDPSLSEELLDLPAAPFAKPSPEQQHPTALPEITLLPPASTESAPPVHLHTAEAQPARVRERAKVHAVEDAPSARPARLSRSIVAIALAMTVLNSALAVVMLGRPGGEGDVRVVSAESEAPGAAHAAPPHESESRLPDPEGLGVLHAHPSLDQARTQISRGEYSAARQHVYGLLAIIDRLDDPRRSALEADCQFLIAQSLHLEALARMGGTR